MIVSIIVGILDDRKDLRGRPYTPGVGYAREPCTFAYQRAAPSKGGLLCMAGCQATGCRTVFSGVVQLRVRSYFKASS